MDKVALKRDGLVFGRALQRAFKISTLYTTEHPAAEEPVRRAYESLHAILKQAPQFTFGFFNRRVVLNELLTPDTSLEPLEQEFFKRGIAAVSFTLGVTNREFRRGLTLLTTKPEVIDQSGGIGVFVRKNPVEGMRIIAQEKRERQGGDSELGMDLQSYMMAQTMLDSQSGGISPSLGLLLQAAGMSSPVGYTGSPHEMLDLVSKATQTALANPEADPKQAMLALAKLLEDVGPEVLFSALPPTRRAELQGRPTEEIAAELGEDMAIEWARRRWRAGESEPGGGTSMVAKDEILRVLGRALQTSAVAERLLQKLAQLVETGELPQEVVERIRRELEWSSGTPDDKHAHLLTLERFNEQEFRHLLEYIRQVGREGRLARATEAASHFLARLNAAQGQERTEALERLPELIQVVSSLNTLGFVRAVAEQFLGELAKDPADAAEHGQIARSLAVAAQSLALFEEYDAALQIGSELERLVLFHRAAHQSCCSVALENLLSPPTIERLLEVSLQKRSDASVGRSTAALLRLVEMPAAEVVFRLLEEEHSAANRSRLLHIARQLGQGAFEAARRRLQDERWYVVRNACYVLGALADPDLVADLSAVLRHSDARVQQAAVTAILKSNGVGRGAALVNALPSLPAHLQETVLDELVLLRDSSAIEPLRGFLLMSSGKTGILEKGLRALAAIPDERVVDVLHSVLAHEEAPLLLRRSALRALKASKFDSAPQRLAQFRERAPTDPLARE